MGKTDNLRFIYNDSEDNDADHTFYHNTRRMYSVIRSRIWTNDNSLQKSFK